MKPLNRKNQNPEANRKAEANFEENAQQPYAQESPEASMQGPSQSPQDVRNLFEAGLNDIYSAEKALAQKLPTMMENATSPELRNTLKSNIATTAQHINRLEKIFKTAGLKASTKKSENIEGILNETEGVLNQSQKGQEADAGIIAAGQKLKQYEVSSLGNLHTYAQSLGQNKVVDLLAQTLNEAQQSHEAFKGFTASADNQAPNANANQPVTDQWNQDQRSNQNAKRNPNKK